MFMVLGSTGHVGGAVVRKLLAMNQRVLAIAHDAEKAEAWRANGADAVVVDVHDSDALRAVFKRGRRAFLLNPPASVSLDTDAEERRTASSIIIALDGSGLEKVVAESTYGAQPGDRIGDLSVLYGFEQALAHQPIPAAVNRAGYYMSNWAQVLPEVKKGILPTMLPAQKRLPMVAPQDLGVTGSLRLVSDLDDVGIRHVEGPDWYNPSDVALAFADVLEHPVSVQELSRKDWKATYRKQGFSDSAADAYARMTAVTIDSGFESPPGAIKGSISLRAYIEKLAAHP
jgi:uncharacterized protein YbjT (DUF2867 family)